MTITVAEVFNAVRHATREAFEAAAAGNLDGEAELAISSLTPVLWSCDATLELNEKQAAAFKKFQQPVPKNSTSPPAVAI